MDKLQDNPIKLPLLKKVKTSRVKDYLKVYSVSSFTSTKTESFRPTRQSRESNTQRNQLISNFPKDKNPEKSEKHSKSDFLHDISVAVSDKFEVLRDLATYEYELTQKISTNLKFEKLMGYLGSLPQSYALGTSCSQLSGITEQISEGLGRISTLKTEKQAKVLSSEGFKIREYNDLRKLKPKYIAVRLISGVRTVISIKGDTFLENFMISLVTCDSQSCINVPIKLDILDVNTLNNTNEMERPVDEKIIPHLFYTYKNKQLCVAYDKAFPSEKLAVVFKLKNWGWSSAILSIVEENIIIKVTDPIHEKKVSKTLILPHDQTLQSFGAVSISKVLSSHLRYKKTSSDELIEWTDSASEEFHKKESSSKLMREDYIKENLGTKQFTRAWNMNMTISGILFNVECLVYHSSKQLVVTSEGYKPYEICLKQRPKSELDSFSYITGLQDFDLAKSPLTVCRSLELRKLIKIMIDLK
jgi:hypothetical protein